MSGASWVDLAATSVRRTEVETDICVIGAGAAGIYLSHQLAQRGYSVVLIEAGPATCVDSSAVGFDAVHAGDFYPGATAGRFFGMGGSTSRWGGLLVPHTANDLRDGGAAAEMWAHIVRIVVAKTPEVLRQLGYRHGPDFESVAERVLGPAGDVLRATGIHSLAGLYLPFRRKNLVGLLKGSFTHAAVPRVFFNAVAKSWILDADQSNEARVTTVVAVSRTHNELAVSAGRFVIAAGAIECARILLEIDESGAQSVLRPTAATGCYLADHLSAPIAEVALESLDLAVRLFAPRFSGGWMRSLRFLEGNPPRDAPRAFAHFGFSNASRGFALAKEVLGAVQARRIPSTTAASVAAGLGDLLRLSYRRFVDSVLYIPPGTPVHLQLDMEQAAARNNHVSLADDKDSYGRRMASIHWQVSEIDMAEMTETAGRFLAKWPGAKAGLPRLQPRLIGSDGTKPYDAYHPVGTCRMGEDAEAVVDYDLKVWGFQNLWVASTGVLPSAGTANPTFSMLCLTHRLAEHLLVRG
jgi:choline dehydrogenase-like flavoprotein